jgi:CHAT domain-containing protein/tetratricopeptide (TPR) repeat protein
MRLERKGKIRDALPRYEARMRELEPEGPSFALFNAYLALSAAYSATAQYEPRLDAAQNAVRVAESNAIYREYPHSGAYIEALLELASAQEGLSHRGAREATLRKALAAAKEMTIIEGRWGWLAYVQEALVGTLRSRGRTEEALALAQEAHAMRERIMSMANLVAWIYPSTASTARLYAADSDLRIGGVYANLGRTDEAERHFRRALDLSDRHGFPFQRAYALDWLAYLYEGRGADQEALPLAQAALDALLRIDSDTPSAAFAYAKVGRIQWRLGHSVEALAPLQESIRRHEDVRSLLSSVRNRSAVFEDRVGPYYWMAEVLLDLDRPAEAFSVSERGRARGFLDVLGMRTTLSRPTRPDLLEQEQQLRARIERLRELPESSEAAVERAGQLAAAREAYDRFLERLQNEDAEQASLTSVAPLTTAEVQALLPPGTVLLEYDVASKRTLLWMVRHDRVVARRLEIGRDALREKVEAFRAAIAALDDDATRASAEELGRLLLTPLEAETDVEHVIVVPYGPLHYLPFPALRRADGRYLVDSASVAYLPSASVLRFAQEKARRGAGHGLVAVGNPERGILDRLPFAEAEVESLRRVFPNAIVLTRRDATRDRVLAVAPTARVLHFAAHAEFNTDDPLGSAILLAAEGAGNGRLEVQEIYGLNLASSLVVVSACETALGKISGGDEMIGLTRAFMYAGAPTVVTTLWKVDDRASFRLMDVFYRALAAGETKAAALRHAQLTIMRDRPQPFFWAAYQLTGETESPLPLGPAMTTPLGREACRPSH